MSIRQARRKIDKVRASRDGHEFHEAWAARKALQLVMPIDGLVGIAVEGLAAADQAGASVETVEIADLVLYYGKRPTFDGARSVVIVQAKYSKGSQSVPYPASDAKKTIRKFAAAYRSHKRKHGATDVEKKLAFEVITNRPIYGEFASRGQFWDGVGPNAVNLRGISCLGRDPGESRGSEKTKKTGFRLPPERPQVFQITSRRLKLIALGRTQGRDCIQGETVLRQGNFRP
jgi:hypothetical protein